MGSQGYCINCLRVFEVVSEVEQNVFPFKTGLDDSIPKGVALPNSSGQDAVAAVQIKSDGLSELSTTMKMNNSSM